MQESMDPNSTAALQSVLDELQAGDMTSIQRLLDLSMDRLRGLAKKIGSDIPGVKRWEQTDDLLQNSAIRLWKALEKHHPATPLDYYRLASAIIRRELIDLSRHHFGAEGMGANLRKTGPLQESGQLSPLDAAAEETSEPAKLGRWTEFHQYVEALPEEERLLFDLLWYQGMTLLQAAEVTGMSERTLRRRWKGARLELYQKLMKP